MARVGISTGKPAFIIIIAGALIPLLASCSASVSSVIRADGGARISVKAEVPAPLAAKLRKLGAVGSSVPTGPFFDVAALRASIAARPAFTLIDIAQPSPDSIRVEVSARSLEELAASPDLKGSGLITVSRGADWTELRFRLERGGAKALAALFPGIDPYLMDALSPPALEEDPVTTDEYKSMLESVLGEKAMPVMEAATVNLTFSAPGAVIGSGGGSLLGSILTAKISLIQALVLEKPIEVWLRWKQ
jgi:hypothetical protein